MNTSSSSGPQKTWSVPACPWIPAAALCLWASHQNQSFRMFPRPLSPEHRRGPVFLFSCLWGPAGGGSWVEPRRCTGCGGAWPDMGHISGLWGGGGGGGSIQSWANSFHSHEHSQGGEEGKPECGLCIWWMWVWKSGVRSLKTLMLVCRVVSLFNEEWMYIDLTWNLYIKCSCSSFFTLHKFNQINLESRKFTFLF